MWVEYSLESPWRGDSNEYQQHMFLWRTDENYPSIIIKYPPYLSLTGHFVGFEFCYRIILKNNN